MGHRIAFAIFLIIMVIVIGPFLNNLKGKELCPNNYSYVEGLCCPDFDKDNLCDEKKAEKEEPKPVEPVEEQVQQEPRTIIVEIFDMEFHPEDLSINSGDTVVWINKEEKTPHTIYELFNTFRSPRLMPGEKYNFTFNQEGEHVYREPVFKFMEGRVKVIGETQITGSAVKLSSAKIKPVASIIVICILIAINIVMYRKKRG